MYNELKGFLKKPIFPENDVNYYKEPLFSEIKGVVKSVIELADVRFDSVIELVGRFKRIPEKLTTFV